MFACLKRGVFIIISLMTLFITGCSGVPPKESLFIMSIGGIIPIALISVFSLNIFLKKINKNKKVISRNWKIYCVVVTVFIALATLVLSSVMLSLSFMKVFWLVIPGLLFVLLFGAVPIIATFILISVFIKHKIEKFSYLVPISSAIIFLAFFSISANLFIRSALYLILIAIIIIPLWVLAFYLILTKRNLMKILTKVETNIGDVTTGYKEKVFGWLLALFSLALSFISILSLFNQAPFVLFAPVLGLILGTFALKRSMNSLLINSLAVIGITINAIVIAVVIYLFFL